MRRRSFLKTMLVAGTVAIGMKLGTHEPSGPSYLEVLREREKQVAIDLATAIEDRLWGWSIYDHERNTFENIPDAKAKLI